MIVKQKKNRKRRINYFRLTLVIAFLCAIIVLVCYAMLRFIPLFVDINGERTVTVEVFSQYEEQGAVDRITHQDLQPVGEVDTSKVGTYRIAYHGKLQTVYRTVKVVDTVAPVIAFDSPYDEYVSLNGEFTMPQYSVSDNYDSDLVNAVTVQSDVDTTKVGEYGLIFSVSDTSGNKAVAGKVIHVVDDDFHYLNTINNKANAPQEMLDVITEYMDLYFKSMKYLIPTDPSHLFLTSRQDRAYMSKKAFENLAAVRRNQTNDLTMDSCDYTLNVKEVTEMGNGTTRIFITEDSNMQFHFMQGIPSQQGLIWNYFYLREQDGQYKLSNVYHEESFFLYLYRNYDGNGTQELDALSDQYLKLMEEARLKDEKDRQAVNSGEITYTYKKAAHPYDREKAAEYATKYGCARNSKIYRSHESNCMNFVSQCMHAGGIPFNTSGNYQWKYLSKTHDEYSSSAGYTFSWTHIGYFQEYLDNKGKKGVVMEQGVNLYLAEAGDILYVDSESRPFGRAPHVVLISGQIKDDEGNIIDLLTCGNTNDQVNYPLSAVGYPYKKIAKISGYN